MLQANLDRKDGRASCRPIEVPALVLERPFEMGYHAQNVLKHKGLCIMVDVVKRLMVYDCVLNGTLGQWRWYVASAYIHGVRLHIPLPGLCPLVYGGRFLLEVRVADRPSPKLGPPIWIVLRPFIFII